MEAVDILDEACEEENFLEALVLEQPQLLHLGQKGAALLTRFFSVKRGFNLMSRLGYLQLTLGKWITVRKLIGFLTVTATKVVFEVWSTLVLVLMCCSL